MTDAILAERIAWQAYSRHCRRQCSPYHGGAENFTGDDTSRALWLIWKAAYEARRAAAVPFNRRTRRWSVR